MAAISCNEWIRWLPEPVKGPIRDFSYIGDLENSSDIVPINKKTLVKWLTNFSKNWQKNCRVSESPKRLSQVALKDISRTLIQAGEIEALKNSLLVKAIVASEDRNFWNHRGVDFDALQNAIATTFSDTKRKVGASTITMQLVKNIFLKKTRTAARKIPEIFLSLYIEKNLSKGEILGQYLRIAEFGPEIYGVTQAALEYFGKSPSDLSLKESLWLSFLLPSPKKRFLQACNRSEKLNSYLNSRVVDLRRAGKISPQVASETLAQKISFQEISKCQDKRSDHPISQLQIQPKKTL